jgi:signal transduction histidine kinase
MNRIRGPRLDSPSWLRIPRRTARLRLTLLAGALFLLSGATLVAVTYLLFDQTGSGQSMHGSPSGPSPSGSGSSQSSQSSDSIPQAHQSIAQSAATVQRASDIHHLLVDFGIALGIVAVLAVLLGWFFAGRMLRPVRTITATARRISASNLKERLSLDDADEEFKQLGHTLDDLFARLDAAFEAQQHFVANASHELRTPLTAERTLLQVALDDPHTTNATWRSTAEEVLASSDEQERLIEALLTLASSEGGLDHRERIDLAVICDDVLRRPNLDLDTLGLHAETAICSAALDGDPRLIERLVANLLDNAIGHNVTGGHVHIATTVTGDGNAVLTVTNTGAPIPPAEINRLFQPFQRLDSHRTHHKDGHGLGLSIVRAIATAHGAAITAHPRPEGGLSIEVTFPPPNDRDNAVRNDPVGARPRQHDTGGASKPSPSTRSNTTHLVARRAQVSSGEGKTVRTHAPDRALDAHEARVPGHAIE